MVKNRVQSLQHTVVVSARHKPLPKYHESQDTGGRNRYLPISGNQRHSGHAEPACGGCSTCAAKAETVRGPDKGKGLYCCLAIFELCFTVLCRYRNVVQESTGSTITYFVSYQ